jgi:hypothetical protein
MGLKNPIRELKIIKKLSLLLGTVLIINAIQELK